MLKIKLNLSEQDIESFKELYEKLAYDSKYFDLDFKIFLTMESIYSEIMASEEDQKKLLDKVPAKAVVSNPEYLKSIRCKGCGHTGWDHAGRAVGACAAESCACNSYV